MSLEEIRTNIRLCCEEMINFTTDHAPSLEQTAKSYSQSDIAIDRILLRAKFATKYSIVVYNRFAQEIADTAVSSKQYETAIRDLANILKI